SSPSLVTDQGNVQPDDARGSLSTLQGTGRGARPLDRADPGQVNSTSIELPDRTGRVQLPAGARPTFAGATNALRRAQGSRVRAKARPDSQLLGRSRRHCRADVGPEH